MSFLYYAWNQVCCIFLGCLILGCQASWAEQLAAGTLLHHLSGQSPAVGALWGPEIAMGFAWVATFKWRPWGLGSKIYLPPFLCGELIDFQNVPYHNAWGRQIIFGMDRRHLKTKRSQELSGWTFLDVILFCSPFWAQAAALRLVGFY